MGILIEEYSKMNEQVSRGLNSFNIPKKSVQGKNKYLKVK